MKATALEITGFNPITEEDVTRTYIIAEEEDGYSLNHYKQNQNGIIGCGKYPTFEEAETKAYELVAKAGIILK